MMQVTLVFAVRVAILTLAMPVLLLFSLVALVDGLVQRDLRRWGGGREVPSQRRARECYVASTEPAMVW